MDEFSNIITMDAENIKKFKKLYGDGRRLADTPEILLSFSMIIPEPSRDDADSGWADNTNQDVWAWRKMNAPGGNTAPVDVIGSAIKTWRMDNWGTTSDVLYDGNEEPFIRTLEGLLKGEFPFYTFGKPPIKVYEKMAADGLVFETNWLSHAIDEWASGKGQVVDGRFQYQTSPMTYSQIPSEI